MSLVSEVQVRVSLSGEFSHPSPAHVLRFRHPLLAPAGINAVLTTLSPTQLRNLIATVQPELRSRQQTGDSQSKVLSAVYWGEFPDAAEDAGADSRIGEWTVSIRPAPDDVIARLIQDLLACPATLLGREGDFASAVRSGKSVPVLFLSASGNSLPISAIHRVIFGLEYLQPGWMVNFAREHFFFRDCGDRAPLQPAALDERIFTSLLQRDDPADVTMVALTSLSTWRFHSKPGWADSVLEHLPEYKRQIDAVQLHELAMPKGLYPPKGTRLEDHVRYTDSIGDAARQVLDGANVAFLLNPVRLEDLRQLTVHREALPYPVGTLQLPEFEVQIQGA